MGYFKDLHTNSDGSCITCGTQQLSYDGYNGCLCSIIGDVRVAADERIIKLLEDDDQVSHIYIDRLIELIEGENK
jgi:hypothetical protein